MLYNARNRILPTLQIGFLSIAFSFGPARINASCPDTTPWSTPVNISDSGDVTSGIFSAATAAGFMVVWADSSNNANYSFSPNGITWSSGVITPTEGSIASSSDVFVAGNDTGFMVTWIDGDNNGWSNFSTDNGATWSDAIQINGVVSLNGNSDVYVSGSSAGFVATMIGNDNNAYVSFSTGTAAWSTPLQVTSDGSVNNTNVNSQTQRQFVSATTVGTNCMLAWLNNLDVTASAYFTSINPFSSTTVYPIVSVGFFESMPIVAELNGYFMETSRANVGNGVPYFSVATIPSNWATFSLFLAPLNSPNAGPWVAANQTGFMSSWVIGDEGSPGSPIWMFSSNNGFNWTPVCSILATPSTTIGGTVGLSANANGFVATWLDGNDSNAYATFYKTPSNTAPNDLFVTLLEQKYGPLL